VSQVARERFNLTLLGSMISWARRIDNGVDSTAAQGLKCGREI
jgi:hypothetical protein